ncbi:MAG: light-harvesting protein [Pseudomonadota bacterium]
MEVMFMAEKGSVSGLTPGEAQEFHRIFVKSAIAMSLLPFLAHISMWIYKPWL